MHDLNTINKINAGAFQKSISYYQAQGRHVLAKYEGLHLVAIETFSTPGEAAVAYAKGVTGNAPATGTSFKLFSPAPAFYAAKRDRSEDHLADLHPVPTPQDKTLADYIARKLPESQVNEN